MKMGKYKREVSAAIAFAILLIILSVAAPAFFSAGNLRDLLINNASTLLVAIGMTLIILAGQIDISVGSQFAVCSIAAGILAKTGIPIPLLFAGVLLIGAAMGALNGALVGWLRLPAIIVTLAMLVILRDALRWMTEGAWVQDLPAKPEIAYTVRRGDEELTVTGPHPMAPVVGSVLIRSAAMDAGLLAGDVILRAGGKDVVTFTQLPDIVAESKGQPVTLTVWRAGDTFDLTLTPRIRTVQDETGAFVERYQIGLSAGMVFEPAMRRTGAWETVTLTLDQMWLMTTTTFSGLWHIITGAISTCNFSGAIGMAETMGDAARNGVESFIGMMAVLSLGVGILNLFPIPVLDGGHLVFHAYEAVARRPPSERALRVLMSIGLTLVLGLMVFALSRDLTCV